MSLNDGLNDAAVGTELLICRFGMRVVGIATVERLTKTQVIAGGRRYRKATGREIGTASEMLARYARMASPEDLAAYRQAETKRKAVGEAQRKALEEARSKRLSGWLGEAVAAMRKAEAAKLKDLLYKTRRDLEDAADGFTSMVDAARREHSRRPPLQSPWDAAWYGGRADALREFGRLLLDVAAEHLGCEVEAFRPTPPEEDS